MGDRWVGRDRVREELAELANEQAQCRLWISAQSPADFTECIEGLFTDSALGDELDAARPVFGAEADALLRDVMALALRIDRRSGPVDAINDPLMPELRALAAATLAAIKAAENNDR